MKKHGVMLFTFVVLFLTLGFDLAYGQEQKENEKVTVTLDFSKKGAFGLKNNTSQSVLTNITFKVQDLSVSLNGNICYHEGKNTYLRLDGNNNNNPGQISISVPNPAVIKSATLGTNRYKITNLHAKYTYNGKEKDEEISVKANKTATVSSINSNNVSFIEKEQVHYCLLRRHFASTAKWLLQAKREKDDRGLNDIVFIVSHRNNK